VLIVAPIRIVYFRYAASNPKTTLASKYGLHAAVIGTDLSRARRVASQLRSGRVVINGMTDDPQAPWGGFKYSGVGREYGRYGIDAFLEPKAILELLS